VIGTDGVQLGGETRRLGMAQLEALQDNLKATQDELSSAQTRSDEQARVIERAGLAEERSSVSALSKFLNDTDFGGVVAASYNYNFEDPLGAANLGTFPILTHNSFQYDQAHFSMSNEATEKSRAGFGVDTNVVTLIAPSQAPVELPKLPKSAVADRILDWMGERW